MTDRPKRQHGGARPGAGRPKSTPQLLQNLPATNDPKVFLMALMGHADADLRTRLAAAVALMPFTHAKMADAGIKDQSQSAAKKAATGKFGASKPPVRLVT